MYQVQSCGHHLPIQPRPIGTRPGWPEKNTNLQIHRPDLHAHLPCSARGFCQVPATSLASVPGQPLARLTPSLTDQLRCGTDTRSSHPAVWILRDKRPVAPSSTLKFPEPLTLRSARAASAASLSRLPYGRLGTPRPQPENAHPLVVPEVRDMADMAEQGLVYSLPLE